MAQEEFDLRLLRRIVLDELRHVLLQGMGPARGLIRAQDIGRADQLARGLALLDGIYLYGSVARGSAKPGVSDLDVTLVLHQPPDAAALATLEALRLALAARHPEVVKIDFDIGSRQQVLDPQHLYSWGYWLKHHCRCLWGTDLAAHFDPFRPSRASMA